MVFIFYYKLQLQYRGTPLLNIVAIYWYLYQYMYYVAASMYKVSLLKKPISKAKLPGSDFMLYIYVMVCL